MLKEKFLERNGARNSLLCKQRSSLMFVNTKSKSKELNYYFFEEMTPADLMCSKIILTGESTILMNLILIKQ